jgi:hypothetical protein
MGGPVTTCRAGSLCWWGGALRGRVHWPLERCEDGVSMGVSAGMGGNAAAVSGQRTFALGS